MARYQCGNSLSAPFFGMPKKKQYFTEQYLYTSRVKNYNVWMPFKLMTYQMVTRTEKGRKKNKNGEMLQWTLYVTAVCVLQINANEWCYAQAKKDRYTGTQTHTYSPLIFSFCTTQLLSIKSMVDHQPNTKYKIK